jgi:hypothetical protein
LAAAANAAAILSTANYIPFNSASAAYLNLGQLASVNISQPYRAYNTPSSGGFNHRGGGGYTNQTIPVNYSILNSGNQSGGGGGGASLFRYVQSPLGGSTGLSSSNSPSLTPNSSISSSNASATKVNMINNYHNTVASNNQQPRTQQQHDISLLPRPPSRLNVFNSTSLTKTNCSSIMEKCILNERSSSSFNDAAAAAVFPLSTASVDLPATSGLEALSLINNTELVCCLRQLFEENNNIPLSS